jgi:hypothetical protein
MYPLGVFIPEGGLIAYGIDRVDMFHRAADYVDRILRGASPVELPAADVCNRAEPPATRLSWRARDEAVVMRDQ